MGNLSLKGKRRSQTDQTFLGKRRGHCASAGVGRFLCSCWHYMDIIYQFMNARKQDEPVAQNIPKLAVLTSLPTNEAHLFPMT